MKASTFAGLGVLFATIALGGCAPSPAGVVSPAGGADVTHASITFQDLLYVSNANGTVSVYRYQQRTLVAVLTDFTQPKGACADSTGSVYVADYQRNAIYEYAHGGKKPIATLDDSPYTPYACAASPPNRNLAVANLPSNGYYKTGNVAIFLHGTGKPSILHLPNGNQPFGCAYDDRGDLLIAARIKYSSFWYDKFYYLPRDAQKLIPMQLPGLNYYSVANLIEGVAWDGEYWVVGPIYQELYLYTISVKASQAGEIELSGNDISAGPVAIYRKSLKSRGTQIVAGVGASAVYYWSYPTGDYVNQITKYLDDPFGVAISLGEPRT